MSVMSTLIYVVFFAIGPGNLYNYYFEITKQKKL